MSSTKGVGFGLSTSLALLLVIQQVNALPAGKGNVCPLAAPTKTTTPSLEDFPKLKDELNVRLSQSFRMKSYMNLSQPRCSDFYEFACGNFGKKSPKDEIHQKFRMDLEYLFSDNANKSHTENDNKVRLLFKSCLRLVGKDPERLTQMNEFARTLGEWPLLPNSNWSSENFDWLLMVAKLRLYGIQSLVYEGMQKHPNDQEETFIILGPGEMEYSITEKDVSDDDLKWKAFIADVHSVLSKSGVEAKTADSVAHEIAKFQKDRVKILKSWNWTSDNIAELTLDELKQKFPERNWNQFFEIITGKIPSGSDKLIIINEGLISELLDHFDCTKPELLANYFFYKLMKQMDILNTTDIDSCIYDIKFVMGHAVTSMYVREYLDKKTQESALDMVNYIKWATIQVIDDAIWMDESTQNEAKLKLSKITPLVGYFKEVIDPDWIKELYHELEIDPNNFIKSSFNALRLKTWVDHNGHNDLNNQDIFNDILNGVNLLSTDVKLIPDRQILVVPPTLLVLPYFNSEMPKSYNFGVLGSIVAQELIHAFDEFGKNFDQYGNYRKWWSKASELAYQQASKCFGNFYDFYMKCLPKGDKTLTISANIVDNAVIRMTFIGYNTWFNEHKDLDGIAEDEVLPDIELNNTELFFLAYTQQYCESYVQPTYILDGPARYRIFTTLSNYPDFGRELFCLPEPQLTLNLCQFW